MVKFKKSKYKSEVAQRMNNIVGQLPSYFGVINLSITMPRTKYDLSTDKAAFELKYTPGWKYGIWLNAKDNTYDIFGEHEDLVQKFRPSRAYFSCSSIRDVIEKIEEIHYEPRLSYLNSITFNQFAKAIEHLDDDAKRSIIIEKYQREMNAKLKCDEDSDRNREAVFSFFKSIPDTFEEIEAVLIDDAQTHSGTISPRYRVYIVLNENVENHAVGGIRSFLERFEKYFSDKQNEIYNSYSTLDHDMDLSTTYYTSPPIKKRYHVDRRIRKTISYKFFKSTKNMN